MNKELIKDLAGVVFFGSIGYVLAVVLVSI